MKPSQGGFSIGAYGSSYDVIEMENSNNLDSVCHHIHVKWMQAYGERNVPAGTNKFTIGFGASASAKAVAEGAATFAQSYQGSNISIDVWLDD
jgi:hypothetical protein